MTETPKAPFTYDFEDVLPTGLCPQCLRSITEPGGAKAIHLELGQEMHVLGLFCPHANAGAHEVIGPGRDITWTIHMPVSIERWLLEMHGMPAALRRCSGWSTRRSRRTAQHRIDDGIGGGRM